MKEARIRYVFGDTGREFYVVEVKDGENWRKDSSFELKEIDGNVEYIDCFMLYVIMSLQEKGYSITISY